jgi:hypothetical protein
LFLPLIIIPIAAGIKRTVWTFPIFACRLSWRIFAFFLLEKGRVDEINCNNGNDDER